MILWLEYSRLQVFPLEVWMYPSTPPGLQASVQKICWYHYGVLPFYVALFSLAAFKFFSLTLAILIMICCDISLFGFILFGTLSASYTWVSYFLPHIWKFLLNNLAMCQIYFWLSSPFGTYIHINAGGHDVIPRSLKPFSFFFLFCYFSWVILLFCLPNPLINSYVSPSLLLISS